MTSRRPYAGDITDKQYGKLTALRYSHSLNGSCYWICRCECGTEKPVCKKALYQGRAVSCGRRECRADYMDPTVARANKRLRGYKNSAKRKGLLWELSDPEAFALFQSGCFYCGLSPEPLNGIDRKDSDRGYVQGNVVPCCKTCNYAKRVMGPDEFIRWIRRVARHQNSLAQKHREGLAQSSLTVFDVLDLYDPAAEEVPPVVVQTAGVTDFRESRAIPLN